MHVNAEPPAASFSEVTVVGRLGARVAERELPSGDTVTVFTVIVDRSTRDKASVGGSQATVDSIACQTFRAPVSRRILAMSPGEWVQVEGTLRRRFWRAGAGLGSAMEVEVRRLERVRSAGVRA